MAKKSRAKAASTCCLFCGRPWTPGTVRKSKEHPLGDWIKQREENHPPEHMSYSTGMVLGEDLSEFVQVRPDSLVELAAGQGRDAGVFLESDGLTPRPEFVYTGRWPRA